ncbi:hypothetical protein [Enterobacter hormaechei]|uniref:hypothetical protein n=1 Tax=Enterobacter hormaechei TaxID=158836 RepID=UPI00064A8F3C|nr:hypothetical protein [Enterobacter hormaechei]KLR40051.1 hypothetical protein ABF56_15695 [Enterobacter hormaechei subsp. steigerwaltii]
MNWNLIWSAVSAIFTCLTALVAIWAMFRWRKQEELKVKLSFKLAIASYSYQLTQMPEALVGPALRSEQVSNARKLSELLSACNNAWFACEGLLDDNKDVKSFWEYIFDNNKKYLNGEIDSKSLGAACMGIVHTKFVFD